MGTTEPQSIAIWFINLITVFSTWRQKKKKNLEKSEDSLRQ